MSLHLFFIISLTITSLSCQLFVCLLFTSTNIYFLIVGPRALKMFGSKANSRLVSYILSNKLYDYLTDIRTSVEVKNGEVIFESHMPYLNIVDRCDMSIQIAPSSLKGIVRRSTHLRTGGEFRYGII